MMIRGQFAQLLAPGLHDVFESWLKMQQRAEEFSHLFNVETSAQAFEDEIEFAGLPPMPTKDEGVSVLYTDAIQGATKRYTHVTYALGVRSSFELYEDDVYGLVKQIPKALARSAHFAKEINAMNVLNLGFSTVQANDGVSLFNNQHPLLGGTSATNIAPGISNVIGAAGTYPNRPATDIDLSFTAIQLMVNHFERMIDAQGLPIAIKPRHIVIPPELKWIAREILGSSHKPYTSDNEINAVLGEDLDYFVSHYTTSQSAWWATCDKSDTWLKFFNRRALDEDFADDFDTRSLKQISFQRFSVGATLWYGIWGSNGP